MKLLDTIQVIFRELFTIRFSHDGYGVTPKIPIAHNLSLSPDSATKTLFTNYSMSCRFDNDRFLCFIRCNLFAPPDPEPKISFTHLPDNLQLRFLLKAGNNFFQKTAITAAGAGQVYHFSNQDNAGTNMFLSQAESDVDDPDLKDTSVIIPEETCLGVIDIYSSNAINSNYELFTGASQQLRSPEYRISFKSKP